MDFLRIALFAVPMGIGLATGLSVLWWTRRKRLAGRRSPLTQGLLRSPGHHLRIQFEDSYSDAMVWLMVMMFFPMLLGAIQSGSPMNVSTALVYLPAAVFAIGLGAYKLTKLHSKTMDLRMGWDAEMATGQELDQLMRRGAVVFHDFEMQNFNIDHVLICSAGVFAVETKSRLKSGAGGKDSVKVTYDGSSLVFPGWVETAAIEQARRQASWLSKELSRAVGDQVPVFPVVALPGWYVIETKRSDVKVLNPKNFHFLLNSTAPRLSPSMVNRIAYQVEQRCRDIAPAFSSAAKA